jgi:hypothetical protein
MKGGVVVVVGGWWFVVVGVRHIATPMGPNRADSTIFSAPSLNSAYHALRLDVSERLRSASSTTRLSSICEGKWMREPTPGKVVSPLLVQGIGKVRVPLIFSSQHVSSKPIQRTMCVVTESSTTLLIQAQVLMPSIRCTLSCSSTLSSRLPSISRVTSTHHQTKDQLAL